MDISMDISTDIVELLQKISLLEEKNTSLQTELNATKEHLKNYTAPARSKKYYENHKVQIQARAKNKPIPSDKKKEYNASYYLRKKLKADGKIEE